MEDEQGRQQSSGRFAQQMSEKNPQNSVERPYQYWRATGKSWYEASEQGSEVAKMEDDRTHTEAGTQQ